MPSVVIFVVDALSVFATKTERNAPISADVHGPGALSSALQLVEVKAGEVQVAWVGSCVQSAENEPESVACFAWIPRLLPVAKKVSSPLCRKLLIAT